MFADAVMGMIGTEIAKMHLADIVHGDLTTSNMMLRHPMAAAPQSPSTQLVRYSDATHWSDAELVYRS